MVEGTGLENRHTGEPGIESSNLSLSVWYLPEFAHGARLSAVRSCPRFAVSARNFDGVHPKKMHGRVAEWFKAHAWKVCVR